MRIYLVRHAEALPRGILPVDDYRYLVPEGRKEARKIGKILRSLGVEWDLILTSPSIRAVQTAEIVAARLKYRGRIESAADLLGGAGDWAKYLAAAEEAGGKEVALVGHEPDLGIALGQALGEGPIALPKGAVAALERGADGTWKALGLLRPTASDWEPIGGQRKAQKTAKPDKGAKPAKHDTSGKTKGDGKRAQAEKAGRETQPARSSEFMNAVEEAKSATEVPPPKKEKSRAATGNGKGPATARTSRKAGTASANEEAVARPAGKRNGRPKG